MGNFLQGKIVIGHGIFADLKLLGISHPPHLVRDTARFVKLVELYNQKVPTSASASSQQPAAAHKSFFEPTPPSWYSARINERSLLASSAPDSAEAACTNSFVEASLSPLTQLQLPLTPTPSSSRSEQPSLAVSSRESTLAVPSPTDTQPTFAPQPLLPTPAAQGTGTDTGTGTRNMPQRALTRPFLYVKHGVSLKRMSLVLLGRQIQHDSHDSVEDALASLHLYHIVEFDFEQAVQRAIPALRAPPWRY